MQIRITLSIISPHNSQNIICLNSQSSSADKNNLPLFAELFCECMGSTLCDTLQWEAHCVTLCIGKHTA